MKIVTVVGARPQFIKASPVGLALRKAEHEEFLVHTGQHYDYGMSQVFFDELGIQEPQVNLGIGSGNHGWQTAKMLEGIENILLEEKPDWVLVYGDTNSTLAGALAAAKLNIPLAHVEAGLRSYNREMPEEHNRVLTDHCSDRLFCPTESAVKNLSNEGIVRGVHYVGDVMYDAVLNFSDIAERKSTILQDLQLSPKEYILATVHRPSNTDNEQNLRNILSVFSEIDEKIVFPVHPRTKNQIDKYHIDISSENILIIPPVGYLDMLVLEKHAKKIMTDSGGIQKEAYFLHVPCVTLREDTEWLETVQYGWNVLVGSDIEQVLVEISKQKPTGTPPELFGRGNSSEIICRLLG